MSADLLLTGGWDRTVKVWDRRLQNGIVNTIHGPFICGSDAIDINVTFPKLNLDFFYQHYFNIENLFLNRTI